APPGSEPTRLSASQNPASPLERNASSVWCLAPTMPTLTASSSRVVPTTSAAVADGRPRGPGTGSSGCDGGADGPSAGGPGDGGPGDGAGAAPSSSASL